LKLFFLIINLIEPYFAGPPQTPTNFALVSSTDTSIVVEWIPGYNGGPEQTFRIQYRIINESKMWITQEIPEYNKQTYILSDLQGDTWYELRMFAENKFDKSNFTDIQSISTVPSVEKGMPSRVSVFCFLTLFMSMLLGVGDIQFLQCLSICVSHILVSAQ
jgi:hypothetical protein